MDFCELNQHIYLHKSSNACDETVRRWRKIGDQYLMLDLRCAYMQIHIDLVLWEHQLIGYKEMQYLLTRLGFAFTLRQKTSSILAKLLCLDAGIDDKIVNFKKKSVENVVKPLAWYGFTKKKPEECSAAQVLGLQLFRKSEVTFIKNEKITRRKFFQYMGT